MRSVAAEEKVTWYLVFGNSNMRGWWSALCRPGFEHVLLFAQHAENVICLDPTNKRLNVRIGYNLSAEVIAQDYAMQLGNTVVKVTTTQKAMVFPPICMYCVALAKYALGLPVWSGITPYGLFMYLIKYCDGEIVDFTEGSV